MGTSMAVLVREYRSQDAPLVRRCIVELQDFERAIDPRLRPGDSMADAYWEQLQARCAAKNGRVFVGEADGTIVGFVAVLAREEFVELDDPPGDYAFVTDLVVMPPTGIKESGGGCSRKPKHLPERQVLTSSGLACSPETSRPGICT